MCRHNYGGRAANGRIYIPLTPHDFMTTLDIILITLTIF